MDHFWLLFHYLTKSKLLSITHGPSAQPACTYCLLASPLPWPSHPKILPCPVVSPTSCSEDAAALSELPCLFPDQFPFTLQGPDRHSRPFSLTHIPVYSMGLCYEFKMECILCVSPMANENKLMSENPGLVLREDIV